MIRVDILFSDTDFLLILLTCLARQKDGTSKALTRETNRGIFVSSQIGIR